MRWFMENVTEEVERCRTARSAATVLGGHGPALTVIITGIYDEAWLLEIEAIAAG